MHGVIEMHYLQEGMDVYNAQDNLRISNLIF